MDIDSYYIIINYTCLLMMILVLCDISYVMEGGCIGIIIILIDLCFLFFFNSLIIPFSFENLIRSESIF